MYCNYCGNEIPNGVNYCHYCGSKASQNTINERKLLVLLLCIFCGTLGIHRFVNGKIGTGIIWLLTGGCFAIGWIVDIVRVACSEDGYF